VSCASPTLAKIFSGLGVATAEEDAAAWEARRAGGDFYNVLDASDDGYGTEEFPLAGQFCSLYLGVGHVKSTRTGDEKFLDTFKGSSKWLQMAA
jgi:hypothetical protein